MRRSGRGRRSSPAPLRLDVLAALEEQRARAAAAPAPPAPGLPSIALARAGFTYDAASDRWFPVAAAPRTERASGVPQGGVELRHRVPPKGGVLALLAGRASGALAPCQLCDARRCSGARLLKARDVIESVVAPEVVTAAVSGPSTAVVAEASPAGVAVASSRYQRVRGGAKVCVQPLTQLGLRGAGPVVALHACVARDGPVVLWAIQGGHGRTPASLSLHTIATRGASSRTATVVRATGVAAATCGAVSPTGSYCILGSPGRHSSPTAFSAMLTPEGAVVHRWVTHSDVLCVGAGATEPPSLLCGCRNGDLGLVDPRVGAPAPFSASVRMPDSVTAVRALAGRWAASWRVCVAVCVCVPVCAVCGYVAHAVLPLYNAAVCVPAPQPPRSGGGHGQPYVPV